MLKIYQYFSRNDQTYIWNQFYCKKGKKLYEKLNYFDSQHLTLNQFYRDFKLDFKFFKSLLLV